MWKWLRKFIERRNLRIASNRNIEDGENKTETSLVVVGVMRFNPDTGDLEPLGTWTQSQIFEALLYADANILIHRHILLREGASSGILALRNNTDTAYVDLDCQSIYLNGTRFIRENPAGDLTLDGLDSLIIQLSDAAGAESVVIQDSGGNPVCSIDSDGHIHMGTGIRLYLDDDEDSYLYCSADDTFSLYTGGTERMSMTNSLMLLYRALYMTKYIDMYETTKPTNSPNRACLYPKEVGGKAHMFAMDEDGNEFDLTV